MILLYVLNYTPSDTVRRVMSQETCMFSNTTVTTQNLTCVCLFAAPQNVLMYFTELQGQVKSFNYKLDLSGKWCVQII